MSRTTLRPCLKHRADVDPPAPTNTPLPFAPCPSVLAPRVHFPPSPGLCQTHLTHSAAIYDRAPIVVLPNACAMPERNGRTFTPTSESCAARKRRSTRAVAQGATLHPQAFAAAHTAPPPPPPASSSVPDPTGRMPSLVPDLSSSESDESDISSTPPHLSHFPQMGQCQYHHPPISIAAPDAAAAFAFLPHANEREKPRRERSRSKPRSARTTAQASEFALPELDGCLGGF
ncbi:hypothetical protein EDB89DRAFT_1274289 [Lactarius sanguifluus]|nr:hypothetical protein EDB89DRAFT_1274289 [Lactarius sanguifluus]